MTIRRLSDTLANRIAAGEVVERPSSIVKELVENALDADAARIEISVDAGGIAGIRVTDDGEGMGAADLELSVERFATSKIHAAADLDAIGTLGFRGEALPSIGSVARLDIVSRTAEASSAARLVVTHGRKEPVLPAAGAKGTRIEVTELFARTPARAKFLKSERSEAQAVLDCVRRLALARPGIDLRLVLDDRVVDFGAAQSLRGRLGRIIGAEVAESGIAVEAERGLLRLTGIVGPPSTSRPTTAAQFFVVNGRPVRDRQLAAALHAAFGDFLPRGRFPVAALVLDLPPDEVDVNVHPAKAEVRFRDAAAVRGLIISAIRAGLQAAGPRPSAGGGAQILPLLRAPPRNPAAFARSARLAEPPYGFGERTQAAFSLPPEARPQIHPPAGEPDTEFPLGAAKAQLFDTYILSQTADGMVLVDMHAAHERLNYEKLKALREGAGVPAQDLLVPAVVDLDPGAIERVLGQARELASLGLVVESFGLGAVLVRATPALLGACDPQGLVSEIAEALGEGTPLPMQERLDRVLSTLSCHGSIRAGRRLKPEEMDALLRQIEAEPAAGTCNHGRPTFIRLSRQDLEKLFGRR